MIQLPGSKREDHGNEVESDLKLGDNLVPMKHPGNEVGSVVRAWSLPLIDLVFTAVKRKNLRHIRLSVHCKTVSVQSVYGAKFVRKLC